MDREERENWLLALCQGVSEGMDRSERISALEDAVLKVPTPMTAEYGNAKHLLVEQIRARVVEEDKKWRQLIIDAAYAINDEVAQLKSEIDNETYMRKEGR